LIQNERADTVKNERSFVKDASLKLKTAVATPPMLRYTLLRKALSTNGMVTNLVSGRSP
jgi:hypothetical protein